jgi:hypothetical protein
MAKSAGRIEVVMTRPTSTPRLGTDGDVVPVKEYRERSSLEPSPAKKIGDVDSSFCIGKGGRDGKLSMVPPWSDGRLDTGSDRRCGVDAALST